MEILLGYGKKSFRMPNCLSERPRGVEVAVVLAIVVKINKVWAKDRFFALHPSQRIMLFQ
jgi:hypothetical protein